MRYVYDIKFEMLQVRKNEVLLRKWPGGSTHLRTLEGTLTVADILSRGEVPNLGYICL